MLPYLQHFCWFSSHEDLAVNIYIFSKQKVKSNPGEYAIHTYLQNTSLVFWKNSWRCNHPHSNENNAIPETPYLSLIPTFLFTKCSDLGEECHFSLWMLKLIRKNDKLALDTFYHHVMKDGKSNKTLIHHFEGHHCICSFFTNTVHGWGGNSNDIISKACV